MKRCNKCFMRGYNTDFSTGVRVKIKCEICKGIGCF
jgi:hypothetical protein